MIHGGSRHQSSLLYQQELQQKHKKKGYMQKIKTHNTKKTQTQVASKEITRYAEHKIKKVNEVRLLNAMQKYKFKVGIKYINLILKKTKKGAASKLVGVKCACCEIQLEQRIKALMIPMGTKQCNQQLKVIYFCSFSCSLVLLLIYLPHFSGTHLRTGVLLVTARLNPELFI